MQISGRVLRLSCAAALFLLACGEVKGTNSPDGGNVDPNADFTLTVDPTSLTIPIAGSAKVTVTVARTGNTGEIALSATGLGANLTAEFSPAAIPDGSTTSEVTISVKGGTTAGTSNVSLTGTAGNKTHSADVSVTTTTITVTGTVRGNRSGVRVGVVGKQSQLSGAGGVFTFTDVTPPYDLYTFADNGCATGTPTPTVFYFDDLTRPDPIVTAGSTAATCAIKPPLCGIISPCPNSSVSGTKAGVGNNSDPVVWVWTEGSFNSPVLNGNGTFSGSASWRSGTTSTGFLHALQLTRKANGAPNTFLGYARSAQTTLTSGQASTINLNFVTVNSTATITGTLNAPTDYPAPSVSLMQEFGTTIKSLWDADTTAIDAAFPLIAQAGGTNLYAQTTLAGGGSVYVQPLTGTATVNFTMPAAAVLGAPPADATGVTTTTMFTWTGDPNVISELSVVTSTPTRAHFRIFTTNAQTTIPVIPELALPSGQAFSWSVLGYGPNTSINEAAAANELESVLSNDYSGPAHAMTFSPGRNFTTP